MLHPRSCASAQVSDAGEFAGCLHNTLTLAAHRVKIRTGQIQADWEWRLGWRDTSVTRETNSIYLHLIRRDETIYTRLAAFGEVSASTSQGIPNWMRASPASVPN